MGVVLDGSMLGSEVNADERSERTVVQQDFCIKFNIMADSDVMNPDGAFQTAVDNLSYCPWNFKQESTQYSIERFCFIFSI
jgi:hypothetical protein